MSNSGQKRWVGRAILVGATYLAIGLFFGASDHSTGSNQVGPWRIAAWAVSALVYAADLGYEYIKLGNSPGSTALHVAAAAGVGGFGLAAMAIVHSLLAASSSPHLLGMALLVWPVITALPAYLVARASCGLLARFL